ncbi:SAM hydrolase/SAM-dependent halogenase family protein [Solitalea lacus]|uniref:SAM hydrolase/SAM-dependent halogenase family protein n=1 Tax=Solitalea lacus TaxID=2911172 RepID=UPI001EDA4A2E|nr:SAM-dependent chlorinase/fluorinase [Solitalea lacus]UKJ06028.1 SAM-dependent chlorinase/fluorinase [Solitalea lacus]
MAIITLTTDLGHRDFYQAALKGAILSQLPEVRIVDISHQISSYNIPQAAFILKNSYKFFPKDSIHIIGIDPDYNQSPNYLIVEYNGHRFIGADNGVFSLLFDEAPTEIFKIKLSTNAELGHFPLLDVFVKAACHLAKGGKAADIGTEIKDYNHRTLIQPIVESNMIRGSVLYIDSFQNVITNISREVYEMNVAARNFDIIFRRNESISRISKHYNDVPEGEKLALFSITGYLEIAINKGNAAGLLGLHLGDMVRIEFR